MNNYMFKSKKYEEYLEGRIDGFISKIDSSIYKTRLWYEKVNVILNLYKQIKKYNFYIDNEIIDIITHKPSKLFIPELTHQSILEYNNYYYGYYNYLKNMIKKTNPKHILDIGCGLLHNAYYIFSLGINIEKYYAVDKNENVLYINSMFYYNKNIEYINNNVLEKSCNLNQNIDIVFMFNIIKHYNIENVVSIIFRLNTSKILIYDEIVVLENLIKSLNLINKNTKYYLDGNFMLLLLNDLIS